MAALDTRRDALLMGGDPGEAKVGNPHVVFVVDENILRFNVTVNDSDAVEVRNRSELERASAEGQCSRRDVLTP